MKRIRAAAAALLLLVSLDLSAADLVRLVRFKLSAGDLASGEASAGTLRQPVVLFFWMAGCGDCKAEAAKVARLAAKYGAKAAFLAPTRLYGNAGDVKDPTPEVESAYIEKVWAETYPGLAAVPRPVDTETMVRYGVSATPTYALVDRKGIVRLYAPTRLTEADLSRRIESLLAEP